ncbi:hypothetical protein ADUPG1_000280 [Aduncisulcus paluster]|uniref:Uncharacterized protein n=1 Tax=Aduncisulcus paluster TaxID=2918883 RepID=A0ABQ5K9B1_9EUKA|nr:hypothetical protein ADUPG1_000280 [Aduncisulcus paluster]
MMIVGKEIMSFGGYSDISPMYVGSYPVGHPDLAEIDGSIEHMGIIIMVIIILFVVSHHSRPYGIKDFDATFTTSDGKKITKEYQMGKMPPEHYFWQEFPIDIDNVISCDIHVISSLDGKQEMIYLYGIRFVIDKKQEKMKAVKEHGPTTIERLSMLPWL